MKMQRHMHLDTTGMHGKQINEWMRLQEGGYLVLDNCRAQDHLANGLNADYAVTVIGKAGSACGAGLSGAALTVLGSVGDSLGDNMRSGKISVTGDAGDAVGSAMRGGEIYVKGSVGVRAGLHAQTEAGMPLKIVIGGTAGFGLGERMIGGTIVMLDLCNTACYPHGIGGRMQGSKIFVRAEEPPKSLSDGICCMRAEEEDLKELRPLVAEFCRLFSVEQDFIWNKDFYVLTSL